MSVQNVVSIDLAKIVTITLAAINLARLQALQIFATGEVSEDGKTIVRMTVFFQGPKKIEDSLARVIHIFLDHASLNGSFKLTP